MERRSVTAAILLAVYVATGVAGLPGFDYDRNALTTKKGRERVEAVVGPGLLRVGVVLSDANRTFRVPVLELFRPLEVAFRIKQDWSLYTDGPGNVARLEIRVDGAPVYRSADPALTWRQPQLSYRRIRPMLAGLTRGGWEPQHQALAWTVVGWARDDWPDAAEVALVTLSGPFPGSELTERGRVTWTRDEALLQRSILPVKR